MGPLNVSTIYSLAMQETTIFDQIRWQTHHNGDPILKTDNPKWGNAKTSLLGKLFNTSLLLDRITANRKLWIKGDDWKPYGDKCFSAHCFKSNLGTKSGGRKGNQNDFLWAHSVLSCICLMPRHMRQSEQHRDQIITKGCKRNTRLSSSFKWAIFSHHGTQHF